MSDIVPGIELSGEEAERLRRLVESTEWKLLRDVSERIRSRWMERLLEADDEDSSNEKARIQTIRPLLDEVEVLSGSVEEEAKTGTMDKSLV